MYILQAQRDYKYYIVLCIYYRRREIILELIHMSYYLILESLYTLTGLAEEEMYRPLHTTPNLYTTLRLLSSHHHTVIL